jgi:NAD(P)-dependent dehydrogenase (short-subunit alcohol dehydrogenase family)
MSVFTLIKGKRGASGFGYASTAVDVCADLDLTGKNIVITGANAGLGLETAKAMASKGAHIIALARTIEKGTAACAEIGNGATAAVCELSDPASIRACVETLKTLGVKIDVILCNAGISSTPELDKQNGIEATYFTNHVGHFMLVTGLLDSLSDNGRVVMVSSMIHAQSYEGGIQFDNLSGDAEYNGNKCYGQSKLANLLFAKELARRFEGTNKIANAVHPGAIPTDIARRMDAGIANAVSTIFRLFCKNVPQGASTQTYAAVHPDAADHNGAYFRDCNIATPSKDAQDIDLGIKLWDETEKLVATL